MTIQRWETFQGFTRCINDNIRSISRQTIIILGTDILQRIDKKRKRKIERLSLSHLNIVAINFKAYNTCELCIESGLYLNANARKRYDNSRKSQFIIPGSKP